VLEHDKCGLAISGVCEIIGAFSRWDGVEARGESFIDGLAGSLCAFAEPMFELSEELLDRFQIGRIFREAEEAGACGTDVSTHGIGFGRAKIVHDGDVAVPRGGTRPSRCREERPRC
jgi:hypothetical protein